MLLKLIILVGYSRGPRFDKFIPNLEPAESWTATGFSQSIVCSSTHEPSRSTGLMLLLNSM